ncbi:MAG: hypothetical protein SGARI_000915 [Bacillariaceae sp.]
MYRKWASNCSSSMDPDEPYVLVEAFPVDQEALEGFVDGQAKQIPLSCSRTIGGFGQADSFVLQSNDWRIWLRFILSFIVNGIGFHFLLHVLPIQVAGQSTIIGVVFRAIGMIYLADLDDCTGSPLTVVQLTYEAQNSSEYSSTMDTLELEKKKQQIVDEAVENVRKQMEALLQGKESRRRVINQEAFSASLVQFSDRKITKRENPDEETPLEYQ